MLTMGTAWLVMFVIFVIAEVATAGPLVSIWFCFGALAAMVAANTGFSLFIQLVVFVVISALFLAATRPFVKKMMHNKSEHTNADRIIGEKGIVTEEINNLSGSGAVKIDGKIWTARTVDDNDTSIAVGKEVLIVEIKGVKAMVKNI